VIPLISSMCMGPLGVRQLPRTWWKVILGEVELLDQTYPDCSPELDQWCLHALELDRERTLLFLRDLRPTYLEFEAWILEQKGGSLDPARIDRWNKSVEKRVHVNPRKIEETYPDIGFDMTEVRITSAVILNCMQDWSLFYKNDLMSESSDLTFSISPLISSLDVGPLGVLQLPRIWLKILMKAKGVLHPDYPDCGDGLDSDVLDVLGLDKAKTLDYLRNETPTYLQFETWVSEHVSNQLDWNKIHEWHSFVINRIHSEQKRVDIHQTIGREDDGEITHGVILNHLEDWAYAYRAVMEKVGKTANRKRQA